MASASAVGIERRVFSFLSGVRWGGGSGGREEERVGGEEVMPEIWLSAV